MLFLSWNSWSFHLHTGGVSRLLHKTFLEQVHSAHSSCTADARPLSGLENGANFDENRIEYVLLTIWNGDSIFSSSGLGEGIWANQLRRIVFGIWSQIGRDGHRDMGDVSTYGKIIPDLLDSMKPPGSNLCADTRRYKYLRASLGVKTERDLHWVERGLTFWISGSISRI